MVSTIIALTLIVEVCLGLLHVLSERRRRKSRTNQLPLWVSLPYDFKIDHFDSSEARKGNREKKTSRIYFQLLK